MSRTGPTPSSIRSTVRAGMQTTHWIRGSPGRKLRRVLAACIGVVSALHVIYYALAFAASANVVGLALSGLACLVAIEATRSGRVWELALLGMFVVGEAVVFVLTLIDAPVPFAFRPLLVTIASSYLGLCVVLVGLSRPEPRLASVVARGSLVALGALAVEAGGSRLLSRRPPAPVLDAAAPASALGYGGGEEMDAEIGPVPIPGSATESRYPDNPRGYFSVRDSSWALSTQPSSEAELNLSAEGVTVRIGRADDTTAWHIQLSRSGYAVQEGAQYMLRFQIRATTQRGYFFAVSMAHPPWESLGLYLGGTAGSEWTGVNTSFTATQSEDSARVHLDLGGDTADIEIADLALARATDMTALPNRYPVEYYVEYRWNSHGCRAPEFPIPAPPGTFRILVLGDSYAAGVGVHEDDVFPSILQRLLRERASEMRDRTRFEVVGCGVSGFGTREERLYYQERVRSYEPDLVLVAMAANDDRSFSDDVSRGYLHSAAKWEQLFHAGYLVQELRHARPKPDFTGAMDELTELDSLVREDGARMAVVVFTNVRDEAWDRLSASADSTAAALGVPLLDLRNALLADGSGRDLYVHPLDRHPNEIAHGIAAESILEWMETESLIPG